MWRSRRRHANEAVPPHGADARGHAQIRFSVEPDHGKLFQPLFVQLDRGHVDDLTIPAATPDRLHDLKIHRVERVRRQQRDRTMQWIREVPDHETHAVRGGAPAMELDDHGAR